MNKAFIILLSVFVLIGCNGKNSESREAKEKVQFTEEESRAIAIIKDLRENAMDKAEMLDTTSDWYIYNAGEKTIKHGIYKHYQIGKYEEYYVGTIVTDGITYEATDLRFEGPITNDENPNLKWISGTLTKTEGGNTVQIKEGDILPVIPKLWDTIEPLSEKFVVMNFYTNNEKPLYSYSETTLYYKNEPITLTYYLTNRTDEITYTVYLSEPELSVLTVNDKQFNMNLWDVDYL